VSSRILEEVHAMKKEILAPKSMGPPVAPYSHGIAAGNMIFTAGVGPFDSEGRLIKGDIKAQTRKVLENLEDILRTGGGDLKGVVQVTIYLTSFEDYPGMNEVYREYFPSDPPPRATIQVAGLWGGMLVEIMAIAVIAESELESESAPVGAI
jgi:reactive intermediate/imine deaminase